MKLNVLTFCINDHENFIINLSCPENLMHSCDFSYLNLIIDDQSIIIGKSIVIDFAQELKRKLELALSQQLKLHDSIKKDVGYYWNQELNEENPDLFLIQDKTSFYWIGHKYLLWTTDSHKKYEQFATWLYNDNIGNIIFEVTPIYPDTFIDPEDPADMQAYQIWLEQSYQSFFTRIIPQDLALQWLNQANLIIEEVRKNDQRKID